MDVYSDVFAALRLEAGLYFTARLKGDFAVSLDAERRRIRFHHVLEGSCFVTVPGQEQVCLSPGDLALIPDGAPQTLSSSPGVNAALPLGDVLARSPPVEGVLSLGEAGPLCRLLCGFLRFDEALDHPVLASLPPLVVLRSSDGPGSSVISAALALLSAEAGGSGPPQASIVQRVVEILLMQTVRAGFAAAPPSAGGFSLALTDPRLAKALAAIHARPE
ncbi:MAG: cupin domain-containing protein, partial [Parvibaculum sp.]